jgi:hypothetical protein
LSVATNKIERSWLSVICTFHSHSFATADAETFYGINQLTIQPTFVDNFVKRLLLQKVLPGVVLISILATKTPTNYYAFEDLQSPDYVQNAMMDKNGLPKPYRIGYKSLLCMLLKQSQVGALSKGCTITSDQMQFGSLPKFVYLSVHPITDTGAVLAPDFKVESILLKQRLVMLQQSSVNQLLLSTTSVKVTVWKRIMNLQCLQTVLSLSSMLQRISPLVVISLVLISQLPCNSLLI